MITVNFKNTKKVKWGMFLALWVACLALPAQPIYAMDRRDVVEDPQTLLSANHAWGAPAEEFNKFMRIMDDIEGKVQKIIIDKLLPSTDPSTEEKWDLMYKDYGLYTKILSNNIVMFGLANKAYNFEDAGEGMDVEKLIATILTPIIEDAELNKIKGEEEVQSNSHFKYENGKYAAFVKNLKKLRTKIRGLTHETAPEFLKGVAEERDPIINAIQQSYFPMTEQQVMQAQKKMLTWVELTKQIHLYEAELKSKASQENVSKQKSRRKERKLSSDQVEDILGGIVTARKVIISSPELLMAGAVRRAVKPLSEVPLTSMVAEGITAVTNKLADGFATSLEIHFMIGDLLTATNKLVKAHAEGANPEAIKLLVQEVVRKTDQLKEKAGIEQEGVSGDSRLQRREESNQPRLHSSTQSQPQEFNTERSTSSRKQQRGVTEEAVKRQKAAEAEAQKRKEQTTTNPYSGGGDTGGMM